MSLGRGSLNDIIKHEASEKYFMYSDWLVQAFTNAPCIIDVSVLVWSVGIVLQNLLNVILKMHDDSLELTLLQALFAQSDTY